MTDFPAPSMVHSNGIEIAVYEAGSGPPVLLLHGFPELAYSWRHQLPALAAAGYRAIAPDLRGYGLSSKPAGVSAYRLEELIADLNGLLDAVLEATDGGRALFVAHDWGALLAWQFALLEPERVRGLASLGVPFLPRPASDPVARMRERLGPRFYIVNFQDSDEADRSFAADPRRFIDRVMRIGVISRDRYERLPPERRVISLLDQVRRPDALGEPLLDDAELDYYAERFAAGGFGGPINWYRNWSHNWRVTEGVAQTVTQPVLFIGAANDVVVTTRQIEAMREHVPDLEERMLADCGHWIQQEQPAATNRLLIDWLERRFPTGG